MTTQSSILDNATQEVLVLNDDKIIIRTNAKVYGILEVGMLRATEVVTEQRYEKQFLEFANPQGTIGSGLLWSDPAGNHQLVFRNNPNRFWISESIDIPQNKSLMIGGTPAISYDFLGNSIVASNLQSLGNLKSLTVNGPVNFGESLYFSPFSKRLGIGLENPNGLLSVYDGINDVEIIMDTTADGNAKIGTHNTKALSLITDNQSRVLVDVFGNVTIGNEMQGGITTKIYGKLSIGVKNPRESLEVAGNIRWANKLFKTGVEIPQTGNYQKGDIVWNDNPKPNTYIGWVCIVSGTPGMWSPFGLIAA